MRTATLRTRPSILPLRIAIILIKGLLLVKNTAFLGALLSQELVVGLLSQDLIIILISHGAHRRRIISRETAFGDDVPISDEPVQHKQRASIDYISADAISSLVDDALLPLHLLLSQIQA
ncbi:hypothetical protein Droror1_Dr00017827 [Drosera rotundifolia]